MNKVRKEISPEDIFREFNPHIISLVENLRTLLKSLVPNAVEKGYPTWRGIGYTHPQAGYFCAIFPEESLVKLGFEWGVLLPDPEGVLQGEGRQMRYLYIHQLDDIQEPVIRGLVEAALTLPHGRSERLTMLNAQIIAGDE